MSDVLGLLGLPADAEAVYEYLLDGGATTAADLATATGLTGQRVRALMRQLEARGLVHRVGSSTGSPPRYAAGDPAVALDAQLLRQEAEVTRARLRAQELSERFHRAAAGPDLGQIVEVVTGQEAVRNRVREAQYAARRELRMCDKPPYASQPHPNGQGSWTFHLAGRGGSIRNIYEQASITVPGRLGGDIFGSSLRGEQDRVLPELPTKLLLVDDRLAIMALQAPSQTLDSAIVVNPSALLDALSALFESLWRIALPLDLAVGGATVGEPEEPSEEERQILALLTAGLPDAAVARELGLSNRTYHRRLHDMMDHLGARTRFQLARQAARRGWLTDAPSWPPTDSPYQSGQRGR
ncbi:MAG TPA: LuxR C-terminal-related transcriptional regulator [Mycobacteriales bacterium]